MFSLLAKERANEKRGFSSQKRKDQLASKEYLSIWPKSLKRYWRDTPHRGPEQPRMKRNLRVKCVSHVETETFLVSVTHLFLRFAIVQNKFQQANETEINHIINNHIKFRILYIFWGSCLLCAGPASYGFTILKKKSN